MGKESKSAWLKYILPFLWDLLCQWYKILGFVVGEVLLALYSLGGGMIPIPILIHIALSALVLACFFAWRKQQRIIELKDSEITKLKARNMLQFHVECVSKSLGGSDDKQEIKVVVHNSSLDKTARNLLVKLVEIDLAQDGTITEDDLPIELHSTSNLINPDDKLVFDLAVAHAKTYIDQSTGKDVLNEFVYMPIGGKGKLVTFAANQEHVWKIKVTADDFPSEESKFKLSFGGKSSDWQFKAKKTR